MPFYLPILVRPRGVSFSNDSTCTVSVSDPTESIQNSPEPSHRQRRATRPRHDEADMCDWKPGSSVIRFRGTPHVDRDDRVVDQPVVLSPNHDSGDEPDPPSTAPSRTLLIDVPSMTEFVGNPPFHYWRCLPLEYWAQSDNDPLPPFMGLGPRPKHVLGLLSSLREVGRQGRHSGERNILPGLLVIDCVSKQVVAAEPGCEFVALSYVWGPGRSGGKESFQSDLRGLRLPQTVQDAMNVVLVLKMRFLWVDRYCINRFNSGTKHHMISNMDAVYGAAPLTIIAAAGSDDESGLPSVSRLFRQSAVLNDTVPPWDGLVHEELSAPAREQLDNSTWSKRGWTYQEGLLSQRHLIFTERAVTLRHDMEGVRDNSGIFDHINEYSRRNLSFPSDLLRAFLGVFRAYERLRPPAMHLCGVPFLLGPDGNIENPGQGLLWKANFMGRLCRIRGSPSWSWAGWDGWCAHNVADWFVLSRRFKMGPYRWLVEHLRHDMRAWEPSDISLEVLADTQFMDISDYFRVGHRPSSGKIGASPDVLYLTAWSTKVNVGVSMKACVHFLDEDLNDPVVTIDPTLDSLHKAEPQVDGHWTCRWTAAVICWGIRDAATARVKQAWTQSLLLERVGEDTYRRVGVLETDWHKSDLDEQGQIPELGRTFTRARLRIV